MKNLSQLKTALRLLLLFAISVGVSSCTIKETRVGDHKKRHKQAEAVVNQFYDHLKNDEIAEAAELFHGEGSSDTVKFNKLASLNSAASARFGTINELKVVKGESKITTWMNETDGSYVANIEVSRSLNPTNETLKLIIKDNSILIDTYEIDPKN